MARIDTLDWRVDQFDCRPEARLVVAICLVTYGPIDECGLLVPCCPHLQQQLHFTKVDKMIRDLIRYCDDCGNPLPAHRHDFTCMECEEKFDILSLNLRIADTELRGYESIFRIPMIIHGVSLGI